MKDIIKEMKELDKLEDELFNKLDNIKSLILIKSLNHSNKKYTLNGNDIILIKKLIKENKKWKNLMSLIGLEL